MSVTRIRILSSSHRESEKRGFIPTAQLGLHAFKESLLPQNRNKFHEKT